RRRPGSFSDRHASAYKSWPALSVEKATDDARTVSPACARVIPKAARAVAAITAPSSAMLPNASPDSSGALGAGGGRRLTPASAGPPPGARAGTTPGAPVGQRDRRGRRRGAPPP